MTTKSELLARKAAIAYRMAELYSEEDALRGERNAITARLELMVMPGRRVVHEFGDALDRLAER